MVGISLVVFAITMFFSPRQRAELYAGNHPPEPWDTEAWEKIIKKYNLNSSWESQYFSWMNEVLHGNLGYSYVIHKPVLAAIIGCFPATFEIILISTPVLVILGTLLGVQSAIHTDTAIGHSTRTLAILGAAAPSFWLGMTLVAIFYGHLNWVPAAGRLSSHVQNFVDSGSFIRYTHLNVIDGILNGQLWVAADALLHLLLPATVVIVTNMVIILRVMRASMLEVLSKSYIVSARAKGLSEKVVINKHARRNALIPTITISGLLVSSLVNGLVIVESVFGIGGLGAFIVLASQRIDVPALAGLAMFAAVVVVLTNLIVDILYAYIDPRVRLWQ
jgi:ABC-type dipeptide/oligopeptide/nickel transport system permease component